MNLNVIKKFADETFWKFVMVGVINTLVGSAIAFFCLNVLDMSLKLSSAMNYFLTSILSYFLNKHFTFKAKENSVGQVLRFALNILVCWFLAYEVAERVALWSLGFLAPKLRDNLAMLIGMGLFVILNYIGQRFFAFRAEKKTDKESADE